MVDVVRVGRVEKICVEISEISQSVVPISKESRDPNCDVIGWLVNRSVCDLDIDILYAD
jgi:hypothetical protein